MQTIQAFAEEKNISKAIIDTWIYRHGLPVIQIGRRIYIDPVDYESWLTEHRKVFNEKPAPPKEIVLPSQRRKSNLAAKMKRIY